MTPQESLKRWHEMAASRELSRVGEIAREDVVFRSPVAHTPYHGREALTLVLSTVIKVFEDFTYHRQFAVEDGKSVALEFSAHVGGKQLKGVDFIRFDDEGLIAEFEVMIRPATGLMALGQAMGAALDGGLDGFKKEAGK